MKKDLKRWQERFAEHLAVRGLAERTAEAYLSELAPFFEFLEGRGLRTLGSVNRELLEDYRTHLFYARRRGKGLTLLTQSCKLTAIKAFFRFLVVSRQIVSDPAARLELPRVPRKLPRAHLSEEEVVRLLESPDLDHPRGLRDRALLEVLYSTAIRNSELIGLSLDDVELEELELRIHQGKGKKSRVVPMGEEARHWLLGYLVSSRPLLVRAASERTVFLSQRGQPFSRQSLAALVRRLARRAELEKPVTPHILRHCCATHMLRRGAGLRHLQELLGHGSATTTQRYTKVEVSDLRRVHRECHPRERAANLDDHDRGEPER